MNKLFLLIIFSIIAFSFIPIAQAHVVVRPNQTGIGTYQTFTVNVPSEREQSTTMIRLVLPSGLESITPNVKQGWKIEVKTHELPSGIHPYEIVWSGGTIPGHYRDEFSFSAKVPANETTLTWKAYQTYSDNSVVSWDLDPKAEQPKNAEGKPDFSKIGPYSETKIINDLVQETKQEKMPDPLLISTLAFVISLGALVISFWNKK